MQPVRMKVLRLKCSIDVYFARERSLKRMNHKNSRIDDFRQILPQFAFLALVALGFGYVFATPPFQVPDEPSHFLKSYELAQGHCATAAHERLPIQIVHLPDGFVRANSYEPTLLTRSFPESHEKLDVSHTEFVGPDLRPADVYSCLPYAMQAMAMVGARAFDLSPIFIFYAGRIGGLLSYLALTTLALITAPLYARTLLLLVAFMPMAMYEAASVSEDGFINGIALLFIAVIARSSSIKTTSRRGLFANVAVIAVLLGQCKLDFCLLPLLAAVPSKTWGLRYGRFIVAASAIAISILGFVLWQKIDQEFIFANAPVQFHNVYPKSNLLFLIHDPASIVHRFVNTINDQGSFYVSSMIGNLGWLTIPLDPLIVVAYLTSFAFVGLLSVNPQKVSLWIRATYLAVGLGSILIVFFTFYIVTTTEKSITFGFASTGGTIWGVQGRYFIPFLVPILWSIAWGKRFQVAVERRVLPTVAILMIVISSADAMIRLHRAYDVQSVNSSAMPISTRSTLRPSLIENSLAGAFLQHGKSDTIWLINHGKIHRIERDDFVARDWYPITHISDSEFRLISLGDPF